MRMNHISSEPDIQNINKFKNMQDIFTLIFPVQPVQTDIFAYPVDYPGI